MPTSIFVGTCRATVCFVEGKVDMLPGELPVFWACGVTPQVAIEHARPELCITHAPGSMLIADVAHSALAAF